MPSFFGAGHFHCRPGTIRSRVLYGSDWPVCLLAAEYKRQLGIIEKYISETNQKITKEGAEKSRFVEEGDFILSNSISSTEEKKVASSLAAKLASESLGKTKSLGIINYQPKAINSSETIPDNMNAEIIGPKITIADGVTVTVGDNSTLTVR